MNRAFVSENDGWGFCQEKRESCMFADEKGQCCFVYCRLYGEEPPQPPAEPDNPDRT